MIGAPRNCQRKLFMDGVRIEVDLHRSALSGNESIRISRADTRSQPRGVCEGGEERGEITYFWLPPLLPFSPCSPNPPPDCGNGDNLDRDRRDLRRNGCRESGHCNYRRGRRWRSPLLQCIFLLDLGSSACKSVDWSWTQPPSSADCALAVVDSNATNRKSPEIMYLK